MNRMFLAVTITGVASALMIGLAARKVEATALPRWEYRVVPTTADAGSLPGALAATDEHIDVTGPIEERTKLSAARQEEVLNRLGDEGWELMSVGADRMVFRRGRN